MASEAIGSHYRLYKSVNIQWRKFTVYRILGNNIKEDWIYDKDKSDIEINTGIVIYHDNNIFFNIQVSIKMNILYIKIFHI